jgi:hypothetical protein
MTPLAYLSALRALFRDWQFRRCYPPSRAVYDAVLDEIIRVDRVLYP